MLSSWKTQLLEKQRFYLVTYEAMRSNNDPAATDPADYMDFISRVIALTEAEEKKIEALADAKPCGMTMDDAKKVADIISSFEDVIDAAQLADAFNREFHRYNWVVYPRNGGDKVDRVEVEDRVRGRENV